MHAYASDSQESRELLSDLEYLWDQVKDIQPSSSDDSAGGDAGPGVPHLNRRRHRPLSHAGSNAESTAALTAANLMSYTQQQHQHQQQQQQIPKQKKQHGSFVGSFTSGGPPPGTPSSRIDRSGNNNNINNNNKRSGNRNFPLPESTLGIPPSSLSGMYRAESYMSGGARSHNSRAADTSVMPDAAAGNRNSVRGSRREQVAASAASHSHQNTTKHIIEDQEIDHHHPLVGSRDEIFYDAKAVAESGELHPQLDSETLEMRKWRRDVNWALETINEEILAIRQRYGGTPLQNSTGPSGSNQLDNGGRGIASRVGAGPGPIPTDNRRNNNSNQAPHRNFPGQPRKGSTTGTDDSEIYKSSILYQALNRVRRLLAGLGIVSSAEPLPSSSYDLSGSRSSFGSGTSGSTIPSVPHRQSRTSKSYWLIFKFFKLLTSTIVRIVIDALIIHILVSLAVKYINKNPQSILGNEYLVKGLKLWDTSIKKLIISDAISTTQGHSSIKKKIL